MDCPGREQATCHGKDFSRLTRFFSTGSFERPLPDPERTTGRSAGSASQSPWSSRLLRTRVCSPLSRS